VPFDGGDQHLGERRHPRLVIGHRDDGHHSVPVSHLHRHARRDQVGLDQSAVGPGPGQQHDQLGRIHSGAVKDADAWHLAQLLTGHGDHLHQPGAQPLPVPGQQRAGGVDARVDRPRRAGRVGGVEGPVQPGHVQPFGPGQDQRALGVGGQRLVRARHHRVGTRGNGVSREVGMKA